MPIIEARFDPQENITVWELARFLKLYFDTHNTTSEHFKKEYWALDDEVQRHIKVDLEEMKK